MALLTLIGRLNDGLPLCANTGDDESVCPSKILFKCVDRDMI